MLWRLNLAGLAALLVAGCDGTVSLPTQTGVDEQLDGGASGAPGDNPDGPDVDDPGSNGGGDGPGPDDGPSTPADDGSDPGESPDDPGDDDDPGPPARSCKRGLGYGYHSTADLTQLSRGVSWWYNWAPQPDEGVRASFRDVGVEFVPMVWGGQFDVGTVIDQVPDGARTLLGFNEPNFFAQANMSPAEAAANWPRVEQIATELGLDIASPAVNFCGGGCHETDPFVYLEEFFAACPDCRVDYIAAHWYACTGDALRWYLDELAKFGKPIWLTEFSCGDDADRSLPVQKRYMQEAVAILEAHPLVHRYAWFAGRTTAIPNVDLLGADGQLTELGELYVSLPAGSCPAP